MAAQQALAAGGFCAALCVSDFAGADAVYTNFVHNDLDAVRQAWVWGLKVVHEQFLDQAACQGEAAVEMDLSRSRDKWSLCDRVSDRSRNPGAYAASC